MRAHVPPTLRLTVVLATIGVILVIVSVAIIGNRWRTTGARSNPTTSGESKGTTGKGSAPNGEVRSDGAASATISAAQEVRHGNLVVRIEKDGQVNRVVVEQGTERFVLDSGKTLSIDNEQQNVGELKSFDLVQLNRDARYLLVRTNAWEVSYGTVFDLKTRDAVVEFFGTDRFGFTPEGRFAYACAANAFGGEYYGRVVDLQSKERVFDVQMGQYADAGYDIRCAMETDQIITFTIERVYDPRDPRIVVATHRFDLAKRSVIAPR